MSHGRANAIFIPEHVTFFPSVLIEIVIQDGPDAQTSKKLVLPLHTPTTKYQLCEVLIFCFKYKV